MTNAQIVTKLQGLLAIVQWRGPKVQTPHHRLEATCPSCQQPFPGPHTGDCEIVEALKLQPADELAPLLAEIDQVRAELSRVREEAAQLAVTVPAVVLPSAPNAPEVTITAPTTATASGPPAPEVEHVPHPPDPTCVICASQADPTAEVPS